MCRLRSARASRAAEPRGRDVDGGSARDLRAEDHLVDEDAQLTGLLPPPTTLMLERDLSGRSFQTGTEKERRGDAQAIVAIPAALIRVGNRYRRVLWLIAVRYAKSVDREPFSTMMHEWRGRRESGMCSGSCSGTEGSARGPGGRGGSLPVCQRGPRGLTQWQRDGAGLGSAGNDFSGFVESDLARSLL